MKRVCPRAFTMTILAVATGRMAGGDPAAAPERGPDEAFRSAWAWLADLEAKHSLLKGMAEVKPVIGRDQQGRLKAARLVFERNAVLPGKGPAQPKDAAKPFAYVSIEVWLGSTPQPPANLHEFQRTRKSERACWTCMAVRNWSRGALPPDLGRINAV